MDKTEHIEVALNELIKRCTDKGGCVWLIDKRGNKYSLRIEEEVKIRPFVPKAREDNDEKNGLKNIVPRI